MKNKIFIQIPIIILFLLPNNSWANWYWDHTMRVSWWITNCQPDGQPDKDIPSTDDVPLKWGRFYGAWEARGWYGYYQDQARVIWSSSGQTCVRRWFSRRCSYSTQPHTYITCQKWDSTEPKASSIQYHNGWTNNKKIQLTMNFSDYGGAGINVQWIEIQYKTSTNVPNFESWTSWSNLNTIENRIRHVSTDSINWYKYSFTAAYNAPSTPWTAYKFRFRVRDMAWNWSDWIDWTDIYKLDTEAPKLKNIDIGSIGDDDWNSNNNNRNFLAWDEKPIHISYKNTDGAPVKIKYNIEDDRNKNMRRDKETTTTSYQFRLPDEFRKVDNDLDTWTNSRIVDLRLKEVIDEAGNVLRLSPSVFNFNVFANITKIKEKTPDNRIWNGVADGSTHEYNIDLIDTYDNLIRPSAKIWRTITRNVQTIENKMYLNQKTRTWDTSVYLYDKDPLEFDTTKVISYLNQSPNPKNKYSLSLNVYTPTASWYTDNQDKVMSDPKAKFNLKTWFTIKDDQNKIRSTSSIDTTKNELWNTTFAPLFTNKITGDLREGWFIEWALQRSDLTTTKNQQSSVSVQNDSTELMYDWDQKNNFVLEIPKWTQLRFSKKLDRLPNRASIKSPINSFLQQKEGDVVGDVSKLQLSTHFVYTLKWKNVIYNGDIIWKDHYFDTKTQESAYQVWIKIIGLANDKNLNYILQSQKVDDSSIIVNSIISPEVYNAITRSVAISVRNMQLKKFGNKISNLDNLTADSNGSNEAGIITNWDKSILYIDAKGENIELWSDTITTISGIRTIVVRGGNLYIKWDMTYDANNKNSVLGVVVQKNDQWQWWNLYIDPEVTNIVWNYIVDGSVISFDGTDEISVGSISKLKNQLYIYWSIASRNTIGWSRANPILCPKVLSIEKCDLDAAQKYDLNYLRRYYLYKNKPFWDGKVAGGWTIDKNWDVVNSKPLLKTIFTNTRDPLAKHPVIIEFNTNIINNPPIGFDIYKE